MAEDDILARASVTALPRRESVITRPTSAVARKARCSPAARAFMMRALRELERVEIPKDAIRIKPTLEVSVDQFERIGLHGKDRIIEVLEACPEHYYVKPELTDDKVRLILEHRMNE